LKTFRPLQGKLS